LACQRRTGTAPPGSRPSACAGLAFGGYVLALALFSTRRAVCVVLGTTVLIPPADVLVLLAVRGFSSPGHLLLHSAGAVVMAAAATWTPRRTEETRTLPW
jgi:hypothetical protein